MRDEITVHDLKRRIDEGATFFLLDVREPFELDLAALPQATHIPMKEVASRLAEIPFNREIIVMCHGGKRSEYVAKYLRQSGFAQVLNLEGGIDAWSVQIDKQVPRY